MGADLWFWLPDGEFCGRPALSMRGFDGAGRPLDPDIQVAAVGTFQ